MIALISKLPFLMILLYIATPSWSQSLKDSLELAEESNKESVFEADSKGKGYVEELENVDSIKVENELLLETVDEKNIKEEKPVITEFPDFKYSFLPNLDYSRVEVAVGVGWVGARRQRMRTKQMQ